MRSSCRALAGPRQRLQNTKDARSHSRELHEAPERPPRATLGRFSALFGLPGAPKTSFSLKRYSEIVTFAISAQATSSEVQNTPEMVSETPPELPKTLPRAPREVPGASPRPLGSGPRRLQRHLSSARDLRSTLEAALKAFQARFWCKLRAPSLLFFLFSCPWPLLSGLVWSVFCCFCSTLLLFCLLGFLCFCLVAFVFSCPWPLLSGFVWSVFCCFCSTLLRFCAPPFSWPFLATEVQLLLLF